MISVALCTYNGEKYIKEQLESILNQTVKVDEIVVGDDGSTDNTLLYVNDVLCESGIEFKILEEPKRLGVSKNFERTICECKGDIIFTSDQDDVWKIDKVEKIMDVFRDSSISLVFSNADLVDERMRALNKTLWQEYRFKMSKFNSHFFDFLLRHNVVTGATMAFRKIDFTNVFPIPNKIYHDQWIPLVAASIGRIVAVNESLIFYRQHSSNVIGAHQINSFDRMKIYFRNIAKADIISHDKYYYYSNVESNFKDLFGLEQKEKLHQCVLFWKNINDIHKTTFIKSIVFVLKNMKYYQRYSAGIFAGIRDVMYCLFKDIL